VTLEQFWGRVFNLCLKFQGSWTSGLRTKKRNARVGGKPNSRHQSGYAIDVVLDDMRDENVRAFTAAADMIEVRVVDERDKGHLHCQPSDPNIGRVVP
jgi:hypothetical protein